MDRRALGKLHVRRAWPRPCHPCRAGARHGRQVHRAEGVDARQYGRLSLDLRDLHPDLSLRRRCSPAPTRPRRSMSRPRRCSPTPCRSTPIAAPDGPRRRSCWSASSISRPTNSGIDPAELRRRNFIPADAFPYQTPVALQYDSGDYQTTLHMALEAADYAGFEARRQEAAARGKLRGIGIATYIEACGIAPSAVVGSLGARAGLFEVGGGARPPDRQRHGPHRLAQPRPGARDDLRAARRPTVSASRSSRSRSSTATPPRSPTAWAPTARARWRSAAARSSRRWTRSSPRAARSPPTCWKPPKPTSSSRTASSRVAGTDRSKTLGEVALTAYVPHNFPHDELEPGLDETAFYDPKNFTFPSGAHIAEIEIDPDTGASDGRQLHRVRRFRPHHQPDDRRGPGPWRARAGHRPGAARRLRLRQGDRPAADRLLQRLRDAARRRSAELRAVDAT